MIKTTPELRDLLRLCRVQASYEDVSKKRRAASTDALLALLRGLGLAIERPEQAGEFAQQLQRKRLDRSIEPVLVAWNGRLKAIDLALPATAAGSLEYRLELPEQPLERRLSLERLKTAPLREAHGFEHVAYKLPILNRLPVGYHRLVIDVQGRQLESLVISAPKQAFNHGEHGEAARQLPLGERRQERAWGNFLPLYALRRQADWGVGDFTGLGRLAQWTGGLGGSAVGTLPLLAASLDEPFEPSPYRPLSRRFWNELYIDVEAIPELTACEPCRQLLGGDGFRGRLQELRSAELVDYRQAMSLKRQALALLAGYFFASRPAGRYAAFERYAAETPELESYARFRAAHDRQRRGWPGWPDALKQGVSEHDYDPRDYQYHQYAQWIAEEQLQAVKRQAASSGCGLYLDLPVGVDPGGFDVWQHQDLFVEQASTGAPPDPFFTKGQDWGLPPLHPERIRETGYNHLRQVLAANMRYARYLRIDHAMGWHRLYWIAPGLRADQGAYVRYEAEELYAVASVESHRWECTLLAENMGTVPPEVGKALAAHGVGGMWVAPYELQPARRQALSPPPPLSVASLNTHDMPTAAAWWRGDDVGDRAALGLLDQNEAAAELHDRRQAVAMLYDWLRQSGHLQFPEDGAGSDAPPITALLRAIAGSPAQLVLITLEDLWLETRSQNVPGTLHERPNWRRKARYALEEFTQAPGVVETLRQVNALRQRRE